AHIDGISRHLAPNAFFTLVRHLAHARRIARKSRSRPAPLFGRLHVAGRFRPLSRCNPPRRRPVIPVRIPSHACHGPRLALWRRPVCDGPVRLRLPLLPLAPLACRLRLRLRRLRPRHPPRHQPGQCPLDSPLLRRRCLVPFRHFHFTCFPVFPPAPKSPAISKQPFVSCNSSGHWPCRYPHHPHLDFPALCHPALPPPP